MSLYPCLSCGVPSSGSRCANCQPKDLRGSRSERGYDSAWRRLRLKILDRDNWICYLCNKVLIGSDATVDHIVAKSIAPDRRLDPTNLAACCRTCNSRKHNK